VIVLLMGVSGAGKTTVGELLASELGWKFEDGDNYHPAANVEKMRNGIPLTDADREPWLENLRTLIAGWIAAGKNTVLACSALKRTYRECLRVSPEVHFVYLKVTPDLLRQRLRERRGHFMTERMLESQLAALQEPEQEEPKQAETEQAVVIDGDLSPPEIVGEIRRKLALI
jgi:gluconokinase